jgi:hypothetical protein
LTDAQLQKFFLSKLAPLQASVLPSVSVKTDPACESYFEEVLEPASIVSQDDMVTALIAIWQRLGIQKLVALEPDQEVSDFIYAMY